MTAPRVAVPADGVATTYLGITDAAGFAALRAGKKLYYLQQTPVHNHNLLSYTYRWIETNASTFYRANPALFPNLIALNNEVIRNDNANKSLDQGRLFHILDTVQPVVTAVVAVATGTELVSGLTAAGTAATTTSETFAATAPATVTTTALNTSEAAAWDSGVGASGVQPIAAASSGSIIDGLTSAVGSGAQAAAQSAVSTKLIQAVTPAKPVPPAPPAPAVTAQPAASNTWAIAGLALLFAKILLFS